MKPLVKVYVVIVILFSLVLSTSTASELKSAHLVSPNQYQLLVENDDVLVLKMVLKPGEQDIAHHHNNETVYFEQGGKLRITPIGAEPFDVEVPNGHVMWHQAWSHQVTNIGETKVKAIIVEARR